MSTNPQAVTERYVSNLLHYGRNKEFDITEILRRLAREEGPDAEVVGIYFQVTILRLGDLDNGANRRSASGATISQALRRALEKHGVTFR